MANEITVPDYIRELVDESSLPGADSLVTSAESVPRISLKGRKFRFKVDGEEVKAVSDEIMVVIVGTTPENGLARTFYSEGYKPGDADPPDCSSLNGVRPDPWISNPVSDVCATCPNSKWGSAESMSGGKAKACKESKILHVIDPTDEDRTVYALQVTVASLKSLTSYGKELASHGLTYAVCLTKIVMDDEADFPKIFFNYAGVIKKEAVKEFIGIAEKKKWAQGSNQNLLPNDQQTESDKPKLTSQKKSEEEDDEPKKESSKPKSTIADADEVLNQWGED